MSKSVTKAGVGVKAVNSAESPSTPRYHLPASRGSARLATRTALTLSPRHLLQAKARGIPASLSLPELPAELEIGRVHV